MGGWIPFGGLRALALSVLIIAGYGRITNVDYSAVVIEIMKEEYTDIPDLKCTLD